MDRIPEPELMDDPEQAAAYAGADFAEVNQDFVHRFCELAPALREGRVVDLGCGPGDIAIRLAAIRPGLEITGVDGAASMLALAASAAADAGVADRIRWACASLPGALPGERFDAVLSNSLLHHLHDPAVLWREIADLALPGAPILVVDLVRPASREKARAIVDTYAAGEPEILRADFENSLCAAFTVNEVRAQLDASGLAPLEVEAISDRHMAIRGRLT